MPDPLDRIPPIQFVFDGPPGPESGRFVEVECPPGTSVRLGEWIEFAPGRWALRFNTPDVMLIQLTATMAAMRPLMNDGASVARVRALMDRLTHLQSDQPYDNPERLHRIEVAAQEVVEQLKRALRPVDSDLRWAIDALAMALKPMAVRAPQQQVLLPPIGEGHG